MAGEHITGKLTAQPLENNFYKKSSRNRKSHYDFNAIRQSCRESGRLRTTKARSPDDEMDFYPKTGQLGE